MPTIPHAPDSLSARWWGLYHDLSVSLGRIMIRLKLVRLGITFILVALVLILMRMLFHGDGIPLPPDNLVRSLDGPRIVDSDESLLDDTMQADVDTGGGQDLLLGDLDGLSPLRAFPPPGARESPHIQDMKAELLTLNSPEVSQSDRRLIQVIRDYWLVAPSVEEYSLKDPWQRDFSMGQSEIVDTLLQQMEGGFFVEVGALDGETRSNSLFFERERKWTGLLMEAGPVNFRQLVSKHRHAYTSPACVSIKPYPNVMQFNRGRNRGRLMDGESAVAFVADQQLPVLLMEVQCFPLHSVLLALNTSTVHYFSLDVEGVELDVLRTIPFHLVDIRVLTVEFSHNTEGKDALREYMEAQGYITVTELSRADNLANDFVFQKR